jgi:hypothetical protein
MADEARLAQAHGAEVADSIGFAIYLVMLVKRFIREQLKHTRFYGIGFILGIAGGELGHFEGLAAFFRPLHGCLPGGHHGHCTQYFLRFSRFGPRAKVGGREHSIGPLPLHAISHGLRHSTNGTRFSHQGLYSIRAYAIQVHAQQK